MRNIITTLIFFLTFNAVAQTSEIELKNGMRVIVNEDHRAPVVVSQVWYQAGSIDEVNGKTGVAHVLEHMMFKGTKTVKPGEFSEIIARSGGRENAFTGTDYTCYFQTMEKSNLELSFKMESDRMQNLVITPEEFNKEIKVVMEERRWRTEDKPEGILNESFNALAFKAHPYSRPIVGWMNDLESMNYEDALEWYQTWYAPNNAILVVSGDVTPDEVFTLAKKYFNTIPSKKLPMRKPQVEPEQKGMIRAEIKAQSELSMIQMGYKVPLLNKDNSKDNTSAYALEVLAGVLSGSSTSRIQKNLIQSGKALSAFASYPMLSRGDVGTFEFVVTSNQNTDLDDIEKNIKNEIKLIIEKGVTEEELNRVKANVIAGDVYEKDSMFYQAMIIGQLETMGYSHSLKDTYITNIQNVKSSDVMKAAKEFFQDDALTVVHLIPNSVSN
jgi:zinc protease